MVMRTTLILTTLSLLPATLLLGACTAETVDDAQINVVVTTSVLGDIVAGAVGSVASVESVSYTHLTLPTTGIRCRSRWSPYH